MQAYDVFMLTVLGAAIAWGAWKGLAWQIASIASIGMSYFVSVNFRGQVSQFFHYQPPEWNSFLAMLVLYLGTSLVIWVAFNLVRDALEKMQLKEFDRQIGGLLGGVKGVLVCTVITLFTMGLGTQTQKQAVIMSRSGYYIARLLQSVEPMLPPEYRQQLDQTIAQLEQQHGVADGTYQQGLQLPFSWRGGQNSWTSRSGGSATDFGSSWGQNSSSSNWGQNQQQDQNGGQGSGWLSSQAKQQFEQNILPRIEQEETQFQQQINNYLPPGTPR
jgi:membrane protein required for colicin V production